MWKRIGLWLAGAASYAAKGALWASQHPEVVQAVGAVATFAGHPEAAAIVAQASRITEDLGGAVPAARAAAAALSAVVKK